MNSCYSVLPPQFIETVTSLYPQQSEEILTSFCEKKPSTFRANTLKIAPEELQNQLTAQKIYFKTIPWLPIALQLDTTAQKELMHTSLYTNGSLYIQGLSSMIPALILNPQKNEKILDLTAAPGSKTTQIAAMMENSGLIVANDISTVRMYKLRANLKNQGITNTVTTQIPGQILWKRYPQYFDKALVDVPCSLEGTFYTGYEKSYRAWTPKKVKILSGYQKFLLRSAISATKPGGTIVYSTCTLEPEENEAVIDWVIAKEKGAVELAEIPPVYPHFKEGIAKWNNKTYDTSITKTKRIIPTLSMEGFFVAKLIKTRSTLPL